MVFLVWLAAGKTDMSKGLDGPTDGDTLRVNGERVRLLGIDAPESRQTCEKDGEVWRAGEGATAYLHELTAGKRIVCKGEGRDRYKRVLARCTADGQDVSRAMLRAGLAWRFSDELESEDDLQDAWAVVMATLEGAGVRGADCVEPREYRRRPRNEAAGGPASRLSGR